MKSQCPSGSNALIGRNIGTDSYIYICRHFDTRDLFAKNHCWTIECNDKRKKKKEKKKKRNEKRKKKKKNMCASETKLVAVCEACFHFSTRVS